MHHKMDEDTKKLAQEMHKKTSKKNGYTLPKMTKIDVSVPPGNLPSVYCSR